METEKSFPKSSEEAFYKIFSLCEEMAIAAEGGGRELLLKRRP